MTVVASASTARLSAAPPQRRALRRAWPLVRPHRWAMLGAALVSLVATVAELAVPVVVGVAVDAAVNGDVGALRAAAGVAAALAAAQIGLEVARRRAAAAAGERILGGLRSLVATAVLSRPLGFFDANTSGDVLARATADVHHLSGFVRDGLRELLDALLLASITLAVVIATSWQLGLVAVVYVPGALGAITYYRRAAGSANASEADAYAATTGAVREAMAARTTLQAANASSWAAERLAETDGRLLAANARVLRADNRLSVTGWMQHAVLAAVVVWGGTLAQQGTVSVGEVATIALALRRLFGPLDSMAWLYGQAIGARARLARILELVGDERPSLLDATAAADVNGRGTADLCVDGVTFAYDGGPPVLAAVSLRVAAGEHVAIVGPSGAGKSTLAKVVAGLLEPQSGRVTLDGRVMRTNPGQRRRVVLVPQEVHVSAGTLADNLRLVPGDHTDEALAGAVEAAGLSGWVESLPAGLQTVLADRGANLSAGERQLVALLRAALADPDVLVLDEATADVDPATEAAVSTALGRLGSGRTLLVIAHRPATAARYRRVVAVAGGRLIETDQSPETRGGLCP